MEPLGLVKFLAINIYLIDAKLFPNHNYNGFGRRNHLGRMYLDLKKELLRPRLFEYFVKNENDYPPDKVISSGNIIGPIHPKFIKNFKNVDESDILGGANYTKRFENSSLEKLDSDVSESRNMGSSNLITHSQNSTPEIVIDAQFSENIYNQELQPNLIKNTQNSSIGSQVESQLSEGNIKNIGPVYPNDTKQSKNFTLEKPNEQFRGPYHPDFIKYLTNSSTKKPNIDNLSSGSNAQTDIYSNQYDQYSPHINYEYAKPRVKIHVFRGPNTKYTVLGKHRKEEKYYSHWGYYISQPAENDSQEHINY